jgi:hypothetical protein
VCEHDTTVFYPRVIDFAKTGSGQTWGTLIKKNVVRFARRESRHVFERCEKPISFAPIIHTNDHFTKTGSGRTKVGLGKALKKRDLFFAGVEEGQLITLFNGGIRNSSGARGPEVIATASNASSFGEQHCSPSDAGAPRCHYTFTVLGHWVSAAAAPQWLEWELSLRVRFWETVLPRFYLYDTNAIICQDRLGTNIMTCLQNYV